MKILKPICLFVLVFNIVLSDSLFAEKKELEIPSNAVLQLTDCSWLWDRNSICLSLKEQTNNLICDIVFVNEVRQKKDYPNIRAFYIKL